MNIKKDADEVLETPEEKEQREAAEAEAEKNKEEKPEAEKTPEEIAAEEQIKKDEEAAKNIPEGEESEEEIEKGTEIVPADGGEAVKSEKPNAEVEPEKKPEEVIPETVEAIGVDEETAKSLPNLVKAGLVTEVKGAGAIKLEKSVVNLIAKLTDAYLGEVKKNQELEAKLINTPEKRALAIHGQFQEKSEEETKKENSTWFKGLFS